MQPQVFLFFVAVINVGVCKECAQHWIHHEGNCYAYGETAVTWGDAQAICRSQNSTLAEVETYSVQRFLTGVAWSGYSNDCVWLGGNDILHEGTWQWSSGRYDFKSYTKWSIRKPSNGHKDDDCLSMNKMLFFNWNDVNCNNNCNFVCVKPAAGAPSNSS